MLTTTTKLPAYTPTAGLAAGTYSWRVRKLDPDGSSGPWSAGVPTFVVAQVAPTLTSPAAAAKFTSAPLLFSWQAVAGAAAYLFESSASAGFTPTTEQVTTVMSTWAPTIAYPDRVTYFWRVKVLDGDGNVLATSAARTFDKDAVAPTVTAVSPTAGLAVDGTVTVTFSEPVKGVAAAGLTLRVAGTSTTVAGLVTPAAATVTSTATFRPTAALVPGQYYDLTVGTGITDVIGNPLTATTTRLRTATTFENTSPAVSEWWDTDAATGASGGSYLTSGVSGATVTFRFTGTTVSVVGRTSATGGYADMLIDGVKANPAAVSFYSPATAFGRTVFSKVGLANTAHTLVVRVLGTRPAGSTGTTVDLDAFMAPTAVQENSPAVTAGFARAGATAASGGTANVYVDGVLRGPVTFFAASPQYKATVYTTPTLADGVHTVRLVATGVVPAGSSGGVVTFDAVTLR